MSLEELKGVLAIGGGGAGVLLVWMLAMRLTPAWTVAVAQPGRPPTRGTVLLLALGGAFGALLAAAGSWLGPLLMFQAGAGCINIAAAGRRRALWLAFGIALQLLAGLAFAYFLYGQSRLDVLKFAGPPVLLAAVCLGLLLRRPAGPAWLKVGLPALAAIVAVATLATLTQQWKMTALWLALASGPLAVAWLRAKTPAPAGPTDRTPPAMEPSA